MTSLEHYDESYDEGYDERYHEYIREITAVLTTEQIAGMQKFTGKLEGFGSIDKKQFLTVFGLCSRWFQLNPINLDNLPLMRSYDRFAVLNSWRWPSLARLLLMMVLARRNAREDYVDSIKQLCNMADVNEGVVLIQSLAFIPYAEEFVDKAREAARSNMTSLFASVAHQSDYAFRYFDQTGWNQMVLKAAFMAVPIWNIYGLRERTNSSLVAMLKDYARERQAASRTVPWDLWCCIAWSAEVGGLDYVQQQFSRGDARTRAAIALALTENRNKQAQALGSRLMSQCEINNAGQPLAWEAIANYTDKK